MESWRKVWRDGIAPLLSLRALESLRAALEANDQRLLQGATTSPPPLNCVRDWPVEAACPISWCGWQGEEMKLVGDVEGFFACLCYECDNMLGEEGGVRHLLNWWDDAPREFAVPALLAEVNRSIREAESCSQATPSA